jgi:hypothetical protein
VSAGGRHFTDEAGTPVFWLGDTQWELFRLFTPETARRVLADRAAKGFNVILIMLTGVDPAHIGDDRNRSYANLEGELPWVNGDPATPNERYFRTVDRNIRLGAGTGQTFVVGIFHQWHKEIVTVPKARGWARWVAARYRDVPGLVWCMYPKATEEYKPVCRELAAGLREGDGGAHLTTMHPDPSVASSSFMHEEPWLAFNMIQTCVDYDRIVEAVAADYARSPVKPVIMAEGGYEGVEFGKTQTALEIRQQAWWTQLAGGYHVYGHNDAWQAPQEWEKWLDSPGSRDLKVFRDVITSLPEWWKLVPDQSLLAAGTGSGFSLNAAARHSGGHWAVAYLSTPSTVTLLPDPLDRPCRAAWINPSTGARTPAGSPAMAFTTPAGWSDAVLLLEAA